MGFSGFKFFRNVHGNTVFENAYYSAWGIPAQNKNKFVSNLKKIYFFKILFKQNCEEMAHFCRFWYSPILKYCRKKNVYYRRYSAQGFPAWNKILYRDSLRRIKFREGIPRMKTNSAQGFPVQNKIPHRDSLHGIKFRTGIP